MIQYPQYTKVACKDGQKVAGNVDALGNQCSFLEETLKLLKLGRKVEHQEFPSWQQITQSGNTAGFAHNAL